MAGDVNPTYKQTQTDISGTIKNIAIECHGFVAQSVSRSEGTGLYINNEDVWFSAHADFDEGNNTSVKPWKYTTTRDNAAYIGEEFEERDALYTGRRVKDPFKKLEHTYPDLNWFDIDKIRAVHIALWLPNATTKWTKDDEGTVYPSGIRRRPDHTTKDGKEWFKDKGEDQDKFMKRVYPSGIPDEVAVSALSGGQTLVPGRLDVVEGDDATPPKTKDNDPNVNDGIEGQGTKPDPRYDAQKTVSGVDDASVSAKKEEDAKKVAEAKKKEEAAKKAEEEAKKKKLEAEKAKKT
jgi:hypothetical protein